MKYIYEKKVNITADHTDPFAKLSLVGLFNYQQEMITEYTGTFKKDNISLKNDYKAAWVFTKCHVVITTLPKWNDIIVMKSEMIQVKSAKCIAKTTIYKENKKCVELYLEMCAISLELRRIIRLSAIEFPMDMEIEEENVMFEAPMESYPENYGVHQAVYSDLDFTRHVNNVSYVRFVSDLLGLDFFEKNEVLSFDIHYKNESRLGDTLKLYQNKEGNTRYIRVSNGEKTAVDVILKAEEK